MKKITYYTIFIACGIITGSNDFGVYTCPLGLNPLLPGHLRFE